MKTSPLFLLIFLLAVAISPACDGAEPADDEQEEANEESETTNDQAEEQAEEQAGEQAELHPALLDPSLANEKAPDEFKILFETTKGDFTIAVDREWAPNGADRLYNLVNIGYFDGVAFFRVIDDFMVQFGIHGNPDVSAAWRNTEIPDDEATQSNTRGKVTFATRGADTRTTQIFVNFTNNSNLDDQGFTPVGEVVEGMDTVDSLYSGYGEGAPNGQGPSQPRMQQEGNEYLRAEFENLDYVEQATILED